MSIYKNIFNAGIIALLTLGIVAPVGAQFSAATQSIVLSVSSEFPEPNQQITASVESFSFDSNRSFISWSVDGVIVAEGQGLLDTTFSVGEAGTETTLRVIAATPNGPVSAERTFRPALVDIVYEAESYTPPLYRGKALVASQNIVRVIAVPFLFDGSGNRIDSDRIIYTWSVGNRVAQDQSGMGRDAFAVVGPRGSGQATIYVTAESPDGLTTARSALTIATVDPFVIFYENDPLRGVRFERALENTFRLNNEEVMITAVPYFLTGNERAGETTQYQWNLNGNRVDNPLSDTSSIVLRETGGSGTATLSLKLQHLENILQRAGSSLRVLFGQTGRESGILMP